MSKLPENVGPTSPREQPKSLQKAVQSHRPVSKNDYVSLAGFLEARESAQQVQKKYPHGKALRASGQMYETREYVAAYECFKPVYDKVVSDMQRILARNLEFEANKLARQQQKPLAVAKQNIQSMKAHAQQITDQFNMLLHDLENKPLVRAHIKKSRGTVAAPAAAAPAEESPPTKLNSASETRLDADTSPALEVVSGDRRYKKIPYAPPEIGSLYSVRDKARGQRIIRVTAKSPDGALVQVEALEHGKPPKQPIEITVDSLAHQAAKGWCNLLLAVAEEAPAAASQPPALTAAANTAMRLDSQNFSRCCADIVRANIKFGTQLIKDVSDGPFRSGDYQQAFLTFEQLSVQFASAVASSRRAIADGRRALTAQKLNMSGKEIQERTAAFVRSEQLIHTAEREFSTILEGLRMYLSAQQD